MNDQLQSYLDTAIKAACCAGAMIKNRFGSGFQVEFKKHNDPVTEVDRASEELIKEVLLKAHPETDFWGEESGSQSRGRDLTWVVDPLDGTKNFVHGYPFVAVSIALVRDSVPIVGVVYDPLRDELFTGLKGAGAFLNGQAITVSDTQSLAESMVVTTLTTWHPKQTNLLLKACQYCRGIRRGGASALDFCQLAAGRIDAHWEWGLSPWDLAAAVVIIREAQGTVTKPDGTEFDLFGKEILATNTVLHKTFRDLIDEA